MNAGFRNMAWFAGAALFLAASFVPSRRSDSGGLPGSWVDAGNYATLLQAIPAAEGKTLLVSSRIAVGENAVIGKNVEVFMINGGSFHVAPQKTLRIDGPFLAPLVRVFEGSGTVRFAPGSVDSIRPQWWGARADGTHDDTAAIQASLEAAAASGHTLRLMGGDYRITDTIVKKESFDCPDILGNGWGSTRFQGAGLGPKPMLRIKGGSGRLCGGRIRGIAFRGGGHETGIQVADQDGLDVLDCRFDNVAVGIEFRNESPGAFTEHVVAARCDFTLTCRTPAAYTVAGGADSFHGSGMTRCTINTDGSAPVLRIGPGANVYNAPADFTAWTWGDGVLLRNDSSHDATLYGNIRVEKMRGKTTVAGGRGAIVLAGTLLANGDGILLGTLRLVDAARKLPDGTTGFLGAKQANRFPLGKGGTVTASCFGRTAIMTVTVLGHRYDHRTVLAVSHDASGGKGAAVTIATLKEFDEAGLGPPGFSVDEAGYLVIRNDRYPASGIAAYIDVVQTGQLPHNHGGRTMGVEW